MSFTVLLCLSVLTATVPASERPASAERACPFAGHNCYSDFGLRISNRKLAMALQAGLRVIEVDVHHVPSAGGFVVTHKSRNPPSAPLLGGFLQPLWARWRDEPGEHILVIDFKAGRPDLAARDLDRYLADYREVLTAYAPDGTLRARGHISVCLSGSSAIGRAYIDLASKKGELLALRDTGPGGTKREAMRRFLQRPRRPGVGYLTLDFANSVIRGSGTAPDYLDWLCEIVAGARRCRYKVRVYTLDVLGPKRVDGRLVSGAWDAHWAACVRAGVDMISTDNYALAAEWWKQIGCKLATDRSTPGPRAPSPQ